MDWWGVFRDEAHLLDALEANGQYRLERIPALDDATLLEAWQR